MQAEGGGGAGDVHVEGEATGAQQLLDLDGDGGVGAFHVGGGADHEVDLGGVAPGGGERLARGVHTHLGHQRGFVVGALAQQGVHHRGIENP